MQIAVGIDISKLAAKGYSNLLSRKGGIITEARSDGYCDKSDFKTKLSDCLDCALEFDIWKYYGNSVSSAAEECGLDATPVESSSSSSSSATASETATETGSQTESSSTPTESSTESTAAPEETTDSSVTVSSTPVIPTANTATTPTTPGSSVSFSYIPRPSSNLLTCSLSVLEQPDSV